MDPKALKEKGTYSYTAIGSDKSVAVVYEGFSGGKHVFHQDGHPSFGLTAAGVRRRIQEEERA